MATTISRTWYNTLVDDTGDNLTGTVWNKAAVDALMDDIDALFTATLAGAHRLQIVNTSSNASATTGLDVGNDGSTSAGQFVTQSSSFVTTGDLVAWGTALRGTQSGGLSISATHASGTLRFYSGGTTERMRIGTTGTVAIGTSLAAPQTLNVAAPSATGGGSGANLGIYSTSTAAGSRNWVIQNAWDNFGDLTFRVSTAKDGDPIAAGTTVFALYAANVLIGGTAARATTPGTKAIQLFDGTAPVGTLANGVSLYSVAGKLWAMDAAGTATKLTP